MERRKPKPFVQLAELQKTQGWLDIKTKTVIPFDKVPEPMLRDAIVEMQKKELLAYNRASFFGILVDKLLDEANNRGLQNIEIYETEFNINNLGRYHGKEKKG